MARGYSSIPIDAPKLPARMAVRTLARVGRFVRPYRRQVVYAAIDLNSIAQQFASEAQLPEGAILTVLDRTGVA